MNVQSALAIGKKLLLGMAQPVNQDMYEAIGATIQELWGAAGYGVFYGAVKVVDGQGNPYADSQGSGHKGSRQYILWDPEQTHRALVDLYL